MPIPFAPLDPASLGEAARKALAGPPPMKLMAARGLAPLRPLDLAAVLYHLANDADAAVHAAAEKTAGELPEKILQGVLADPALDAKVIDFFAPRVVGKPPLVEAILLNRATADVTVVDLVPKLGERDLEMVAQNEQRLLRCPEVIAALYLSPKARMSTVDRVVELAVRNNIRVPGIPAWNDVVAAVLGQKGELAEVPEVADDIFAAVARVAVGDITVALPEGDDLEVVNALEQKKIEEEKKHVPYDKLPVMHKIRLATMGNAFARAMCIRDMVRMVAVAAINAPGVTDSEVIRYSANRTLASEVIYIIANTREWTKLYAVKVNLVNNPKTPLPASMKLLPFLREKELRNVGRSRGIPNALVQQARKLLTQKGK